MGAFKGVLSPKRKGRGLGKALGLRPSDSGGLGKISGKPRSIKRAQISPELRQQQIRTTKAVISALKKQIMNITERWSPEREALKVRLSKARGQLKALAP